jgi:hypothetical protein
MKLFNRSSAILTLALAAMGTTAAHATSINIAPGASSYEIGASNLSGFSNGSGYNFVFDAHTSPLAKGDPTSSGQTGLIMDNPAMVGSEGTPFIALDADYQTGALSTTNAISLQKGDVVTLTFNFAAAQQLTGSDGCASPSCTGNFDALLLVQLGGVNATVSTPLDAAVGATPSANILTTLGSASTPGTCESTAGGINPGETKAPCIASQTWSGWETETLTFDITNNTNSGLFSFLASDPNMGAQDPAFALLDNINYSVMTPTPEPNSLMLLGTGLAGLGGFVRSRFKKGSRATA